MKHIELWHAINPTFMPAESSPTDLKEKYVKVAEFSVDVDDDVAACERVFASSQNLEEAWGDGSNRSTSVGDLFMVMLPQCNVGVALYEADMIGMKLIKKS